MFIIRLIYIIVVPSYYCQLFRLLRVLVFIVHKHIIVLIPIIGMTLLIIPELRSGY
jgi:hypothetical protein